MMPNINSPTVHPILFSSTLQGKKELLCEFTPHFCSNESHTELTNQVPDHQHIHSHQHMTPHAFLYQLKITKTPKAKSNVKTPP